MMTRWLLPILLILAGGPAAAAESFVYNRNQAELDRSEEHTSELQSP